MHETAAEQKESRSPEVPADIVILFILMSMSSQTNTLTEGPLAKQIFLVSLPLALSNLLVARFYGARHPKDVEKTVHSAAIISAVAGVVLLLIGLLGSPAMLRLLHGGGPCRRSSGQNSSDRHSR